MPVLSFAYLFLFFFLALIISFFTFAVYIFTLNFLPFYPICLYPSLSLQFRSTMDSLFHSFNSSISVANFAELSACVFSWLEEYCKPQV